MRSFENRKQSFRLPSWDYGSAAMYFVTICTRKRNHYFGGVKNGEICLSALGEIAEREWYKTPEVRPDMNLELGEFVVMPNHIHGILIIGNNEFNRGGCRGAMHRAPTTTKPWNNFGPQRKNLASVIRGYKSAVTTWARINRRPFNWQPLFYEHIIRSEDELLRISSYIRNNPENWEKDQHNNVP